LQRVMEKLGNVAAGDNLGCQFGDSTHAEVYIRGKIFENPMAAEQGNEAAGFGVWFSDSSVWYFSSISMDNSLFVLKVTYFKYRNVSSAWLEEFPLSKNNVEIVAALIAVKIAATFLGNFFHEYMLPSLDI
jgi:hypothetical protein